VPVDGHGAPVVRSPRYTSQESVVTEAVGFFVLKANLGRPSSDVDTLLGRSGPLEAGMSDKPTGPPASPPPAPAAWRAPLDVAKAAASKSPPDWPAAANALADAESKGAPAIEIPATLSKGVDAYNQSSTLTLLEPVDGATITAHSERENRWTSAGCRGASTRNARRLRQGPVEGPTARRAVAQIEVDQRLVAQSRPVRERPEVGDRVFVEANRDGPLQAGRIRVADRASEVVLVAHQILLLT